MTTSNKIPKGTERWPAACRKDGEWIQLPKVLVKRLGALKIRPNHLWLLLALQVDRFQDRDPRFYWEELARWCGRDKNTVRRWGYQLQAMGLVQIQPMRGLNPEEEHRPGHRNERNKFVLTQFGVRLEKEQEAWEKERKPRQKKKKVAA